MHPCTAGYTTGLSAMIVESLWDKYKEPLKQLSRDTRDMLLYQGSRADRSVIRTNYPTYEGVWGEAVARYGEERVRRVLDLPAGGYITGNTLEAYWRYRGMRIPPEDLLSHPVGADFSKWLTGCP